MASDFSRGVAEAPRLAGLAPTVDWDRHRASTAEGARGRRRTPSKTPPRAGKEFIPDYDAPNMPAADKRAAYALEHIAFRVGRIEKYLARIAAAIRPVPSKA